MLARTLSPLVVVLVVTASVPLAVTGSVDANEAPLVDAGLDRTVEVGETVLLDGAGSRDPDGRLVSLRWSIETPDDQTIEPRNETAMRTRFDADRVGRYVVTLTATDDEGATRTDSLYVTVEAPPFPHVQITGPDVVPRNDTARYTAEATVSGSRISALAWSNGDVGDESTRRFTDPAGSTVTLSVVATAANGRSASATKTVRVVAPPNEGPTVSITGPETLRPGTVATYRARTNDPDGTVEGVAWGDGSTSRRRSLSFSGSVGSERLLRVTATDDDGATATASKRVRLVGDGDSSNRPPDVDIRGPRSVERGSTHTFAVDVDDPDGDAVSRIEWTHPDRTTGRRLTHKFDAPAGSVVNLDVEAADVRGNVGRDTAIVWVTADPTVQIQGVPDVCFPTGTERTLTGVADSPVGRVTAYEWSIDGAVVGHTSSLTHEFRRNGSMPVTLTVRDSEGGTASTTRSVCTTPEPANHDPEIQDFTATWFAGLQTSPGEDPVPHDAFATSVLARFPIVEYDASATDADGDDLTYRWSFGDGGSGVTAADGGGSGNSITHDYSTALPTTSKFRSYDVTLTVVDDQGGRDSVTRTIRVRHRRSGSKQYELTADKTTVAVGEPVEFTVRNVGRGRFVDGDLYYGDGQKTPINANSITNDQIWTFDDPGTYSVQFRSGNEKTGFAGVDAEVTITVRNGQFTEYHYGIREEKSTVAAESPGNDWNRGSFDHYQQSLIDVRVTSALSNSPKAKALENRGYYSRGTWTERERIGTRHRLVASDPGSGWSVKERNVDTVRKQSGWDYETFDNRQYASDWSLVREARHVERLHQSTTSRDRPDGAGWTLDGSAGKTQNGWERGRTHSRSDIPSDGQIVGKYEYVTDKDTSYTCNEYQDYRNFLGRVEQRCTDWDMEVDYDYGTGYRYKSPHYETVWRWARTIQTYDIDYTYRRPDYVMVPRNEYVKPLYRTNTHVRYRKDIYETQAFYEWNIHRIREEVRLTSPDSMDSVVWVRSETHDCPSEGDLADEACQSPPQN